MKFWSNVLSFLLPLPLWYPFSIDSIKRNEIQHHTFFSNPYISYRDKNDSIIIHSNICPHQGGLFSNGGYLNNECNIVCPYHGFTYENGTFIGIHNQDYFRGRKYIKKKHLPTLRVREIENTLFVSDASYDEILDNIYYPPEHYDSSFRFVSGHRILNNNFLTVTENLLDMLHISFVHSFGSVHDIPSNIKFKNISSIHGKTSFEYRPSKKSLGKLLDTNNNSKQFLVHVENEFILPTTTITRVSIQDSVKTVFTQSIPIDENRTILSWRLYRNFWTGNCFMNNMGDFFVKQLMEQVIEEDIKILKNINVNDRKGVIRTKYDKTILEFRKFMNKL